MLIGSILWGGGKWFVWDGSVGVSRFLMVVGVRDGMGWDGYCFEDGWIYRGGNRDEVKILMDGVYKM